MTTVDILAIGAFPHIVTVLSQQPGDSSAWFDRGRIHQRELLLQ